MKPVVNKSIQFTTYLPNESQITLIATAANVMFKAVAILN